MFIKLTKHNYNDNKSAVSNHSWKYDTQNHNLKYDIPNHNLKYDTL